MNVKLDEHSSLTNHRQSAVLPNTAIIQHFLIVNFDFPDRLIAIGSRPANGGKQQTWQGDFGRDRCLALILPYIFSRA